MNWKRISWYPVFKYAVYGALLINVLLFLNRELASSEHRFGSGFSLLEFIEAFTATIDTAAWIILLLLFELETYVLPEEKIKGALKWIFMGIRTFCYVFVVYSFFGYLNNYLWLGYFEPASIQSLCNQIGHSWMKEVTEFEKILQSNCNILSSGNAFLKYEGQPIFTDLNFFQSARHLAITDVVNSGTWILVVIVLEIDVWLQLRHKFTGLAFTISKYVKNLLYLILLGAAIYWGLNGTFLDFWDAFLWIIAFVFIEMNLVEWKKETELTPA